MSTLATRVERDETIQCPKCESPMERLSIRDQRNANGRWIDAEFIICSRCSYPMLVSMQTLYGELMVLSCDVSLFTGLE